MILVTLRSRRGCDTYQTFLHCLRTQLPGTTYSWSPLPVQEERRKHGIYRLTGMSIHIHRLYIDNTQTNI